MDSNFRLIHVKSRVCLTLLAGASLLASLLFAPNALGQQDGGSVLVTVDGYAITENHLALLCTTRQIDDDLAHELRHQLIEQLIDRYLIRKFLEGREATPSDEVLNSYVQQLYVAIKRHGDEPEELLERLGFDEERLKKELALPLAWRVHVDRVVTSDALRDYFRAHREQFDGTKIRASHIVRNLAADAAATAVANAKQELAEIRERITKGELSFAEAATQFSDGSSASEGGDLGFFRYRGQRPVAMTGEIFSLEDGAISEPFRSPFGVHIAQVTDRQPGQLSLEDVREQVKREMSRELWDETVAELRSQVKLVYAAVEDE